MQGAQDEKTQGAQNEKTQGAQNEKTQGAQNEKTQGAQNEKTQGAQNEKTQGAQGEKTQGAQGEKMQGNQRAQSEKGAEATQRNEQATGAQTKTGGAMAERTTHVNPQQVHVTGRTHIANDKAAEFSDRLLATARPEHVNVNVNVGAALPATVALAPLPANVVDIVPEFRGYDYVVENDEIVIVQPSNRQVVDIINTGGATAMNAGGTEAMANTRLNPCGTP